jgi:hypothetical protein
MKKQAFGKKLFLNRETLTLLDMQQVSGGTQSNGPTACGTCTTLTSDNSNCGYGSTTTTQPLCA